MLLVLTFASLELINAFRPTINILILYATNNNMFVKGLNTLLSKPAYFVPLHFMILIIMLVKNKNNRKDWHIYKISQLKYTIMYIRLSEKLFFNQSYCFNFSSPTSHGFLLWPKHFALTTSDMRWKININMFKSVHRIICLGKSQARSLY